MTLPRGDEGPGRPSESFICHFQRLFIFLNLPLFFQLFILNIKTTEKFQEEYNEYPYTLSWDSSIVNMLPRFTFFIIIIIIWLGHL